MKKVIFTLVALVSFSAAFAQFEAGRKLVGGNFGFGFSTAKIERDNATTTVGKGSEFTFTPQFGYFVIDNLALGAGIGLSTSSFKEDGSSDKRTDTEVTFSPFARYYFGPGVFVHGGIDVGSNKVKYSGDFSGEEKESIFGGNIGVGYAIFLNDHVAIEPMVAYEARTLTNKTPNQDEDKFKTGGLAFRVGLQIYLD